MKDVLTISRAIQCIFANRACGDIGRILPVFFGVPLRSVCHSLFCATVYPLRRPPFPRRPKRNIGDHIHSISAAQQFNFSAFGHRNVVRLEPKNERSDTELNAASDPHFDSMLRCLVWYQGDGTVEPYCSSVLTTTMMALGRCAYVKFSTHQFSDNTSLS